MKTKFMRRTAVIVLTIALLTTTVLCGTMAKYTTSVTGTDNARVAYWGFNQNSTGKTEKVEFDLFDAEYESVVASSVNVVAPGTEKSETVKFEYTANASDGVNAPEVDYSFNMTLAATGSYSALDANPNFVWKLTMIDGTEYEYQKVEDLQAMVASLNGNYNAGTLPEGFSVDKEDQITIGWEWKFTSTIPSEPEVVEQPAAEKTEENATEWAAYEQYLADLAAYTAASAQDGVDTTMGNATDLDDVTFVLTITATQLETAAEANTYKK